jgi:hypothetical protein
MGINGSGVTIGIVEAGGRIDENHLAFAGRIAAAGITNAINNHATMVGGQAAANYRSRWGWIYLWYRGGHRFSSAQSIAIGS